MPTHIHIVAKIPKKQWDQGGEAMGRNEMKKWIVVINRKGQGPWKTDPDQSHHSLGFLVDWGCQSTTQTELEPCMDAGTRGCNDERCKEITGIRRKGNSNSAFFSLCYITACLIKLQLMGWGRSK
jgi:hypothetical protein